jgi:hypothetical protein
MDLTSYAFGRNVPKTDATHHDGETHTYFKIPVEKESELADFVVDRFMHGSPLMLCEHPDKDKPHRFYLDLDTKHEADFDLERFLPSIQNAITTLFPNRTLRELPEFYKAMGIDPVIPDPYTVVVLFSMALPGYSYHLIWPFLMVSPRAYDTQFAKMQTLPCMARYRPWISDKPRSLRAPFCDRIEDGERQMRPFIFEGTYGTTGRRMRPEAGDTVKYPLPDDSTRRDNEPRWLKAVWALTSLRFPLMRSAGGLAPVILDRAEHLEAITETLREQHGSSATQWGKDPTVYSGVELEGRLKEMADADASTVKAVVVEYLNRCIALLKSKNSVVLVKIKDDDSAWCKIKPMTVQACSILFGVPLVELSSGAPEGGAAAAAGAGGDDEAPRSPPRGRRRTAAPKKPKITKTTPWQIWVTSTDRLEIREEIFHPETPSHFNMTPNDVLNLWRGFAYTDEELVLCKNYSLNGYNLVSFLEHVYNVTCSHDMEIYNYLMDWFAFIMTFPWKMTLTCPILVGDEGVGKTMVARAFGNYLGAAYVQVTGVEPILGRFNSIMMGKLLVQLDEIDHLTDGQTETLKHRCSEMEKTIEYKNVDSFTIDLPTNLLITSNNTVSQILKVGPNARRWALIKCTNYKSVLTKAYFVRAFDWLDLEGAKRGSKSFIAYLKTRDVSGMRTTTTPRTPMLMAQKMASMPQEHLFLHECVHMGCVRKIYYSMEAPPEATRIRWEGDGLDIDLNVFHDCFVLWCEHRKTKSSNVVVFSNLMALILEELYVMTTDPVHLSMKLRLPPARVVMAKFQQYYGLPEDDSYFNNVSEPMVWKPLPFQVPGF